jgi:hypothetical protein
MTNIGSDTRAVEAMPGTQLDALIVAVAAIDICVGLCRKLNAPRTADELEALRLELVHTLGANADAQVH